MLNISVTQHASITVTLQIWFVEVSGLNFAWNTRYPYQGFSSRQMPQLGDSCLLSHSSVASRPTILHHVVWDTESIVKQTTKTKFMTKS